jgi:hypothetical protein
MSRENTYSILDQPIFKPLTQEFWFNSNGDQFSRPIFETQIKLKKGTLISFIETISLCSASHDPFFLKLYTPTGSLVEVEIRGYLNSPEQNEIYDLVNVLVSLTKDQELVFFPIDIDPETESY